MAIKMKRVPIDKVEVWEKNPRNIKKSDFQRLKEHIQRLGVYKPLVCCLEKGRYITLGGNMRLLALRDLGQKEVEISVVTAKTDARKLEYALSDNDRAGEYDDQTLAELIYSTKDSIDTSIFKVDIARAIGIDELLTQFGPGGGSASGEDSVPEPQPKPVSQPGELYRLGPHRLLCGDATKPEFFEILMAGKKADLIFTDPPYNVAYRGGESGKFGEILGDDMSEEDYVDFIIAAVTRMKENLKTGGVFYICSGYSSYPTFAYAMKATGLIFSGPIIWVKNNTSLGWADYRKKHEMVLKAKSSKRKKAQPVLYGWNKGKHYFPEHKFEADVWEIPRRASQTMLHPTQKPLDLIQRAIRNSSRPDEAILDSFAGSGSTIIAADREGRTAYAMELDPRFVDVIIRRYAAQGGPTEEEIRATRQEFVFSGIKVKYDHPLTSQEQPE